MRAIHEACINQICCFVSLLNILVCGLGLQLAHGRTLDMRPEFFNYSRNHRNLNFISRFAFDCFFYIEFLITIHFEVLLVIKSIFSTSCDHGASVGGDCPPSSAFPLLLLGRCALSSSRHSSVLPLARFTSCIFFLI